MHDTGPHFVACQQPEILKASGRPPVVIPLVVLKYVIFTIYICIINKTIIFVLLFKVVIPDTFKDIIHGVASFSVVFPDRVNVDINGEGL